MHKRIKQPTGSSAPELVALLIAARRAKNRWVEQEVRRQLREQHGVRLAFGIVDHQQEVAE